MNINEVYLISNLLDEKPIFSLQPPPKSKLLYNSAISSMIKKGLLENAESFTDKGVAIAKRIAEFKTAQKYIKIGLITIGLIDEKQAIFLIRDPFVCDYKFSRIDMSHGIDQMINGYDFLKNANESQSSEEKIDICEKEVFEKYQLGYGNCIYLSTLTLETNVTNELIFTLDGQVYLYDRDAHCLSKKNLMQIEELFRERLAI